MVSRKSKEELLWLVILVRAVLAALLAVALAITAADPVLVRQCVGALLAEVPKEGGHSVSKLSSSKDRVDPLERSRAAACRERSVLLRPVP